MSKKKKQSAETVLGQILKEAKVELPELDLQDERVARNRLGLEAARNRTLQRLQLVRRRYVEEFRKVAAVTFDGDLDAHVEVDASRLWSYLTGVIEPSMQRDRFWRVDHTATLVQTLWQVAVEMGIPTPFQRGNGEIQVPAVEVKSNEMSGFIRDLVLKNAGVHLLAAAVLADACQAAFDADVTDEAPVVRVVNAPTMGEQIAISSLFGGGLVQAAAVGASGPNLSTRSGEKPQDL